jgi:SanA protein
MLERWRPRLTRKRLAMTATFATAAALSSVWPIRAIERRVLAAGDGRIFKDAASAPRRYVAIVLGAAVDGDVPSDVLEDRLQTALELYNAHRVERVLVSGDHGASGYDEVRTMRLWLVDRGVPSDDVFLDHAGFRTLDTMLRAAQVFQVKDAVVVTQEFHLPRALFLARAAGIDAVGVVADHRRYAWAEHYARRELLARVRSWLDVSILGTGPRYLGAPIPITGSADATHDAETTR